MAMQRLDKIICAAGLATRSEVKKLIKSGAVAVDGVVASDGGMKLETGAHTISCCGKPVNTDHSRCFMLNKPKGVLSATEDREQKTVLDLFSPELRALGLFPVGRLDKDTTGLLLLTNDGELSHKITSPRHSVVKCYEALVDGELTEQDAAAFAEGIELRDGTKCLPARLKLDPVEASRAQVYISEGKYHQVKRMLAALGKPVLELHRRSIGALELDLALSPGEYRELSAEEIELLFTK